MVTSLSPSRATAEPVPSAAQHRREWNRKHYLALVVIALAQALVRAVNPLGSDMLWGARFGWDFLQTGHLPAVDSWSWTASGHRFIANSWAWNVAFGLSYHAAGVYGFWLLGALMSVALALTVGRVAAHYGVAPLPLLAVYAAVGPLALETLPRAQVLTNLAVLLVPLLAVKLMRAADRRSVVRTLGLIGLFELVWMNLHEGALIGPVLLGGATVAIAVGGRDLLTMRAAIGRAAAAVAVSGVALLITPYGVDGVLHSLEVRSSSVGLVNEWQPAGFSSGPAMLGLAGSLVGAALAVWVWRRDRYGVAACMLLLAVASLSAIRFLPELAVLAMPELAAFLVRARVRDVMWVRIALAGLLVIVGQAALEWRDLSSLGPPSSPSLVQALPTGCRLLNDDLVGDAVILLRPDVRVGLDGRNDVYGRSLLLELIGVFRGGPHAQRWVNRRHVTCVLAPTAEPLVQQLEKNPDWQVRGSDRVRTLLVRRGV